MQKKHLVQKIILLLQRQQISRSISLARRSSLDLVEKKIVNNIMTETMTIFCGKKNNL